MQLVIPQKYNKQLIKIPFNITNCDQHNILVIFMLVMPQFNHLHF